MKKITIVFATLLSLSTLLGQTDKGRFIYGGTFSVLGGLKTSSITTNSLSFNIAPQFGYFPIKNFAILGVTNVGYSGNFNGLYNWRFGFGPELRYYVGKGNIKFYAHTNVIGGGTTARSQDFALAPYITNYFSLSTSTGPGLAIFPNTGFGIHTSLSVNTNSYFAVNPTTNNYLDKQTILSLSLNVTLNGLFSILSKTK